MDRAKFIDLGRTYGPYHGRNVALELAAGDFVAIQDADDVSHPARFQMQLDHLATHANTMLCTTRHVRIDDHGKIQLEAGFRIFGDGPMTSMFRREAFDRVGNFAPVRSRGDVEMRDRISSYYGENALFQLPFVGMLCYAASSTLSQRVKSEYGEHLQLWRTQISRRPPLHGLRGEGHPVPESFGITVPRALRAMPQGGTTR